MLVLSLLADLALQSRNSTVVSALLLLATSIVLLKVRSRYWRIGVAVIGLVGLLGTGSLKFDSRWQGLRESIAFGWSSTDGYWMTRAALNNPVTPSGMKLEESAYLRSAWARQAVDFIAEHPMGIGFGHDSFGNAMEMKYRYPGLGSSHSGWLDFAIGTGLAGLALLLTTASVVIRRSWRQFRERQNAQALLLAFFVGGYLLRCLLDGHLSGWRLGLFAFVVGILIAGMREQPENP
jgi:O-antigen ligase